MPRWSGRSPWRLVVKNGSQIRARSSGLMPLPVSLTRMATVLSASGSACTVSEPGLPRIAWRALSTRLKSTCWSWPAFALSRSPAGMFSRSWILSLDRSRPRLAMVSAARGAISTGPGPMCVWVARPRMRSHIWLARFACWRAFSTARFIRASSLLSMAYWA